MPRCRTDRFGAACVVALLCFAAGCDDFGEGLSDGSRAGADLRDSFFGNESSGGSCSATGDTDLDNACIRQEHNGTARHFKCDTGDRPQVEDKDGQDATCSAAEPGSCDSSESCWCCWTGECLGSGSSCSGDTPAACCSLQCSQDATGAFVCE